VTRLRITGDTHAAMETHLFRPDHDEHAAIVLAGIHRQGEETILVGRELHLLDENDFPPGEYGYRQFSAAALARLGTRAARERLGLVSCHSHPGATTRTSLSADDRAGHRRVFPHLLDIVDGAPVAGVAFGTAAAAGEVWFPGGDVRPLDAVELVGHHMRRLTAGPPNSTTEREHRFDRQARMLGTTGQRTLRSMTVGVVGLGGGGSMIAEQLAHLGVRRIVAIDFDVVKTHNLSRIVGATEQDAERSRKKVEVARRLAARIDPTITFEAVDGDIADADVAERLLDCDFVFLATDTITSRLVANAISHSYFVPMVQIGAKVDLRSDKTIESVYVAVRPVFPGRGCLHCAGLISPAALQHEVATEEERAAQNYVGLPDVIDPSVITLNGIAASAATNIMLMFAVCLADEELLAHRLLDARTGTWLKLRERRQPECLWCGSGSRSRYGRGDDADLPLRKTATPNPRIPGLWLQRMTTWIIKRLARRTAR
jgi:molybdopterin/thiamine biosynthesis adenylyltransferase